MDCEKFAQMLDRYADLTDAEMCELEAHAEMCEGCADELAFMRSILSTVKSLPPIEPPSDFLESVNARLDKELAKETPVQRFARRSRPYVYRYGSMAACVALAVAVGVNADSLLSKMNGDTSGVLIEEKTADSADSRSGKNDMAIIPPEQENEGIETESTFIPSSAFSLSTPEPKYSARPVVTPSPEANVSQAPKATIPSSTSTSQQKSTGSNNASSRNGSAAKTTESSNHSVSVPSSVPVSAPESQPTAAQNNTAKEISQNETSYDAKPAASTALVTNAPIVSDIPQAEPSPNNEAEQGQYSVKTRNIVHDDEYAVAAAAADADATQTPTTESSDYTIAYNTSDDSYAYAAISTILAVKETNAARAQEIIDVFISGTYGNYYKITATDMKNLLGQFDREGIWYEISQVNSSDTIWFKVITMKS